MRRTLAPLALPLLSLAPCLGGCYGVLWGDPLPTVDDDDSAAPLLDDDDDDDDASPSATPTPPPEPEVVALSCAPAAAVLQVPYEAPQSVPFTAEATWDDGASGPLEAGLTWTVEGGIGGTITPAGQYTSPGNRGGTALIRVSIGDAAATCSVDAVLRFDIDASSDGAIPAAATASGVGVDDGCAPVLLYPTDGTVLPRNQASPRFQWTAGSGANTWVLRIEHPHVVLQVATHELAWTPPTPVWTALAASVAGQSVALSVLGGAWDPGSGSFPTGLCTGSATAAVGVSAEPLLGTVFYWGTGNQGVMRVDMGQDAATRFLTIDETGYCVGCHAVNASNPDRMAFNFGGGNGWAVVADVTAPTAPVLAAGSRNGNFTALSPDGTRLVRSFQGALYLDDLVANTNLAVLPAAPHATHPAWSADGDRIAYASCSWSADAQDWVVSGCHLRTLTRLGPDQWGDDATLLPPDPAWNFYYPTFSPDDAWIAFNRSTGDAYDDPDATLMILPATGGTPIALDRANLGANLHNSWPRWGPMVGDEAWLAFASRRPYGAVTAGTAQVWLTAIDIGAASAGLDPSAPAAWLTGQDPGLGNHTPVWVPRFLDGG